MFEKNKDQFWQVLSFFVVFIGPMYVRPVGSVLQLAPKTKENTKILIINESIVRYLKLWLAHAPGMPVCMPGSLISGSVEVGGGENVPGFRRKRNPQFYVSDKRPMLRVERYI